MWKKKFKKTQETSNVDINLLKSIQVAGGITFRDEVKIRNGNGYEQCIYIYKLPSSVDDFWLGNVLNIANTVATVDISTLDIVEVRKNLNKSMKEQSMRYDTARNPADRIDAQNRYNETRQLYQEIESFGNCIKLLSIRIFVSAYSQVKLEERVENIMTLLDSKTYSCTSFLNETKNDWCSMFRSYTRQQEEPFSLEGIPITSETLAIGNPFHYSELNDPNGTYLGDTSCGGIVNFDLYYKTVTRLHYNAVVTGTMGSGKSTLLKKIFEDRAIRGDYIRAFDITGEFTTLTKTFGGKILHLDGTDGILNPLEILRSGDNEYVNFGRHISKMVTIYRFLVPSVERREISEFQDVLTELYQNWGLAPNKNQGCKCTGLLPEEYPTFSDFYDFINQKITEKLNGDFNDMEKTIVKDNLLLLNSIKKNIGNIINSYGTMFDGHTSIPNILDEQIVTFDISVIKNMAAEIFDAIIFNVTSLCWDNLIKNGSIMKELWEKGKIDWIDIVRFLLIIDESHKWINMNKPQALDIISTYMKEARKYFGGIILASQSLRDYAPEGDTSVSTKEFNKIKEIFENTQYKFIFKQDDAVNSLLQNLFGNSLTESQRNKIPILEQGNCILLIAGERNIEFKVFLTEEENRLFTGGA